MRARAQYSSITMMNSAAAHPGYATLPDEGPQHVRSSDLHRLMQQRKSELLQAGERIDAMRSTALFPQKDQLASSR